MYIYSPLLWKGDEKAYFYNKKDLLCYFLKNESWEFRELTHNYNTIWLSDFLKANFWQWREGCYRDQDREKSWHVARTGKIQARLSHPLGRIPGFSGIFPKTAANQVWKKSKKSRENLGGAWMYHDAVWNERENPSSIEKGPYKPNGKGLCIITQGKIKTWLKILVYSIFICF